MKQFLRIFDKVLDYSCVFAFIAMMVILCLQIFFRYVLESPLTWSTPLSMFFFIWAIWLGGAVGIRDRTQIRVELAEIYLPHSVNRVLVPAISLLCCAFLVLMILRSFAIIEMQSTAIYDTLPFTRDHLFVVVPSIGLVMLVNYIRVFLRQVGEFYFNTGAA